MYYSKESHDSEAFFPNMQTRHFWLKQYALLVAKTLM
jgi:hypothetical protein